MNGKIFTADPDRPYAEALATLGDKVLAVGTEAQVRKAAGKKAQVVDLGGRTLVPGINDAHLHAIVPRGLYLNSPAFVPGPGPTLSEVQAMLQAAAQGVPAGQWLFVLVGTATLDDANANRFSLDGVTPDHPVWLQGWSGHGTVLNTKALRTLGLADDQPDPWGGSYERLPGTNTLTGVAHEYAEYLVYRAIYATMSDDELIGRYQASAQAAVQLGFTSWQDMAVGLPHERTVRVLRAAKLPLRVRSICFQLTPFEGCDFQSDAGD
ncbi:MAG: amidohydrolase family protein, partial [Deltaproteobacteria bacterium]|nr:amidohydrolase family protein [Deltaproteobacteria bacterium]